MNKKREIMRIICILHLTSNLSASFAGVQISAGVRKLGLAQIWQKFSLCLTLGQTWPISQYQTSCRLNEEVRCRNGEKCCLIFTRPCHRTISSTNEVFKARCEFDVRLFYQSEQLSLVEVWQARDFDKPTFQTPFSAFQGWHCRIAIIVCSEVEPIKCFRQTRA